ncbi:OmpP1/FadL family transporter [Chitinibacteraceae bacterium HSL-7]
MIRSSICVAVLYGLSTSSYAGGLYLYEIGTEDVGLAGAGSAARAGDASTMFGNPAGLTRLQGDHLDFGAQLLFGNSDYHITDGIASGGDPGNVLEPFPGVSTFYSHSINDRLKVGIGMWGNFGLALHYGNWAGDHLIKDAAQLALTLQPTVAYRLNEQWSVGAGLGINYGLLSLKRDTANGEETSKDHDWQANVRLGLLFEPSEQTRFGLNYASETDYAFQINPTVTLRHPVTGADWQTSLALESMVNTPQQLMFSAYHALTPQWAVMGNLGWQDWSSFNGNSAAINDISMETSQNFRDTWHAALGAQYQMDERWRFNGGLAYDSSMYKNQSQGSLTMPTGATWRFGAGVQRQLDATSRLGVSFEYLRMQGSGAPSTFFGGEFDTGHLYFVSTNYSRAF